MVKVWVLKDEGKKEPLSFLVDGYEPETNTLYQFHGCHWHGHTCLKNRTRRQQKRYKDTCRIAGLINLSKIMNGIQGIASCQPGTVKNQY